MDIIRQLMTPFIRHIFTESLYSRYFLVIGIEQKIKQSTHTFKWGETEVVSGGDESYKNKTL